MNVETPALLLNVAQLERNIENIIRFSEENGVQYRPHIKTHKSIEIAKLQMKYGAIGITVAKVGEAEVMAEGGIDNILIAYPIANEAKIDRIKQLRTKAHIIVAVDSVEQAKMLATRFTEENPLHVWIKVNSGLNRVGVEPNEEVVTLAKSIKETGSLYLDGIFTHAGQAYGAATTEELEEIGRKEAETVLESVRLCEEVGITIRHRSIGSTPTYRIAGAVDGITEIRPGNAVFFDMVQVGLGVATKEECALTVKTSVVSVKEDRVVLDAGSKTLALDRGAHGNDSIQGHGYIKEHPSLVIERLSEEHGVVPLHKEMDISLNDVWTVIPNHTCVVANLFDTYTLHRDGTLIGTWPVDARGKLT